MFLALDDMLDAEDLVRFEACLKAYPSLAELWGSWQAVDQQLVGLPKAAPAPGFVDRFDGASDCNRNNVSNALSSAG